PYQSQAHTNREEPSYPSSLPDKSGGTSHIFYSEAVLNTYCPPIRFIGPESAGDWTRHEPQRPLPADIWRLIRENIHECSHDVEIVINVQGRLFLFVRLLRRQPLQVIPQAHLTELQLIVGRK